MSMKGPEQNKADAPVARADEQEPLSDEEKAKEAREEEEAPSPPPAAPPTHERQVERKSPREMGAKPAGGFPEDAA